MILRVSQRIKVCLCFFKTQWKTDFSCFNSSCYSISKVLIFSSLLFFFMSLSNSAHDQLHVTLKNLKYKCVEKNSKDDPFDNVFECDLDAAASLCFSSIKNKSEEELDWIRAALGLDAAGPHSCTNDPSAGTPFSY